MSSQERDTYYGEYRVVTFKIDDELLSEVDSLAKSLNKTRSDVIREAVRLYIKLRNADTYIREPIKYIRLES